MFFEGTLQEGIAAAVQQAKLVVCFVTDDGEESKKWEHEYLIDASIEPTLSSQSMMLRLIAGSEEAKYLAAIFPLPKTPTMVLIRNGMLKEYIPAGVSEEDFMGRIKKALGLIPPASSAPPAPIAPNEQLPGQPAAGHRSAAPPPPVAVPSVTSNAATVSTAIPSSNRTEESTNRSVEMGSTAATTQQKLDKGKGKAQEPPQSADDTKNAEVQKASEMLKKRKQDALDEKRRILEQIEHDKQARKARDEQRRAERKVLQEGGGDVPATATTPITTSKAATSTARSGSETCALQVRDFDGSTIRTRLPSSGTLRKEVREWVDANRSSAAAGGPYLFKVVLTPQPNRTVEETEEDRTLGDLELAPSATLILVPVQRFATAYTIGSEAAGGRAANVGLIGGVFRWIWHIINGFILMLRQLLGAPLQARARQGEATEMQRREGVEQGRHSGRSSPSSGGRQDNARVTGFRNPNDDRRDQQLYNGNSLNFEPRPDEDSS